jgi:hypothetical protein
VMSAREEGLRVEDGDRTRYRDLVVLGGGGGVGDGLGERGMGARV